MLTLMLTQAVNLTDNIDNVTQIFYLQAGQYNSLNFDYLLWYRP